MRLKQAKKSAAIKIKKIKKNVFSVEKELTGKKGYGIIIKSRKGIGKKRRKKHKKRMMILTQNAECDNIIKLLEKRKQRKSSLKTKQKRKNELVIV